MKRLEKEANSIAENITKTDAHHCEVNYQQKKVRSISHLKARCQTLLLKRNDLSPVIAP